MEMECKYVQFIVNVSLQDTGYLSMHSLHIYIRPNNDMFGMTLHTLLSFDFRIGRCSFLWYALTQFHNCGTGYIQSSLDLMLFFSFFVFFISQYVQLCFFGVYKVISLFCMQNRIAVPCKDIEEETAVYSTFRGIFELRIHIHCWPMSSLSMKASSCSPYVCNFLLA